MKFKNYRSLNIEELDEYLGDLSNEFNNTKEKIDSLCDYLLSLEEEWHDVNDEKSKRELLKDNGE